MLTQIAKLVGLSANNIKESAFLNRFLPDRVPWQPLGFTISVTTKCNLKCVMCARTIYGMEGINMSKELFSEAAKHFDNKTITILGNGEPFLHPNLFEFIEICQKKNAKVNLVTNGTLLTKEKSKQLLEYPNIRSVTFSIDGAYENYDKIRINSNFQAVCNNLWRVCELRGKSKYPLLAINFVGMKSNSDDFPELIRIFGNYVDAIELAHPIIFLKNSINEHLNKNIEHAKEIFSISNKISCRAKIILRNLAPHFGGCIEPWTAPYIGINGNVYPCCMIGGGDPQEEVTDYYDSTSMVRKITSLGNVADFDKIWNGEEMKQFRNALRKVNVEYLPKNYKGNDTYLDIVNQRFDCYCKVCSYRWHCAC